MTPWSSSRASIGGHEAVIGSEERIQGVAVSPRVGAHRRWGAESLSGVRGRAWDWNPDKGELRVRLLTDEEKALNLPKVFGQEGRIHRRALMKDWGNLSDRVAGNLLATFTKLDALTAQTKTNRRFGSARGSGLDRQPNPAQTRWHTFGFHSSASPIEARVADRPNDRPTKWARTIGIPAFQRNIVIEDLFVLRQ